MLNVTHKTKASYDYIKIPVFVYQIGCNVRKRQNTVVSQGVGKQTLRHMAGARGWMQMPKFESSQQEASW